MMVLIKVANRRLGQGEEWRRSKKDKVRYKLGQVGRAARWVPDRLEFIPLASSCITGRMSGFNDVYRKTIIRL